MKNQIPKNWQQTTLGGTATLNYGKPLPEPTRREGGIPVYGSSGITGYHSQTLVQEESYIIGRKGTVGSVNYAPAGSYPIDTVYYVPKSQIKCDFNFFYYLLRTVPLNRLNFDSAVPGLNRDIAYSQEIAIPNSTEEQKRIASILSTFDDKIGVNHKIAKTLEEMAQTIFKEWFVNFKFPGHEKVKLIDSELGKIPKGWGVKFPDIAYFQEGPGIRNWQYRTEGIPFINIRCFKGGKIDLSDANYLDPKEVKKRYSHFLLNKGDFIVSSSGTLGRIAKVRRYQLPLMLNTSVIRIRPAQGFSGYCFVKYFLKSKYYQNQILGLATGSAQLNYGPSHLKMLNAIKPTKATVEKFEDITRPIENKLDSIAEENKQLGSLRDLLLPKLMKGEIRV